MVEKTEEDPLIKIREDIVKISNNQRILDEDIHRHMKSTMEHLAFMAKRLDAVEHPVLDVMLLKQRLEAFGYDVKLRGPKNTVEDRI